MTESPDTAHPLAATDAADHPLHPGLGRRLASAAALALLCALLQALLPTHTLGAATLAPLSVVLGVVAAAAMARGRWTVPAALLGVLAADLGLRDVALPQAQLGAAVLGLQTVTFVNSRCRPRARPPEWAEGVPRDEVFP